MTYSVTIKVKKKIKKKNGGNIVIYKKNYLLNTATSSEINEYIEYLFFILYQKYIHFAAH